MEIWDLYNETRQPIGKTMIRGEKVPEGKYRIIVCLCIIGSDGRMLVQRRALDKDGWPGLWDISCGGSAIAGEDSQCAIERELFEELGIKYDLSNERPKVTYSIGQGFVDVYIIRADYPLCELTLQESEVMDAAYATRDEIMKMIEDGSFIPYHKSIIDSVFFLADSQRLQTNTDKK